MKDDFIEEDDLDDSENDDKEKKSHKSLFKREGLVEEQKDPSKYKRAAVRRRSRDTLQKSINDDWIFYKKEFILSESQSDDETWDQANLAENVLKASSEKGIDKQN
ncbi:hypothetical protein [Spirochaeta isovalerica]|uniref:Uncharacterized protein n=1 Tax=Spirochaeta isovalerica TaxID=150 RepID=A0A841R8B6_9SPIO|nr:hypothetical protein [Spirochaeta isovalerica]MBB6481524.1 hypothetical protein [Spirochaeta isovalerica]